MFCNEGKGGAIEDDDEREKKRRSIRLKGGKKGMSNKWKQRDLYPP